MRVNKLATILAILAFTAPAAAADFDGSQDLLCASLRAVDCTAVGECSEGAAADFNIPQFFTISFKDKAILAKRPDESELNTPFESTLDDDAGTLVLQGIEAGRGWTAAISPETGRMVFAVSGEDVSFSLFAACTPKP